MGNFGGPRARLMLAIFIGNISENLMFRLKISEAKLTQSNRATLHFKPLQESL